MPRLLIAGAMVVAFSMGVLPATTGWTFTDVRESSGITFRHPPCQVGRRLRRSR